jgi:hypothetical protein
VQGLDLDRVPPHVLPSYLFTGTALLLLLAVLSLLLYILTATAAVVPLPPLLLMRHCSVLTLGLLDGKYYGTAAG